MAEADEYPMRPSAGQKLRVTIARAMAMESDFLFMDEPTSTLDPQLGEEVLCVIVDLTAEGQLLIIVTHNMDFVCKVGDRILFLDKGVITFDGKGEAFFTQDTPRIRQFLQL